ncbi:MAG: methyltransferase [Candidatus Eisenbacteria bacterium]|uniref:Methyltransferase n=1 Tax=Eiseniibacteriota bacterium TaxID=2212470 RepID=A0A849SXA8_UNCEI|nr:methyltransferase [Candidatus Eisenbacteria bacterium]
MTIEAARAKFERFLRWTIEVEYPAHQRFLPAGEREAFGDYYKGLPKPGDEEAIRRKLRGTWRGDAGWTARWLARRDRPVVLDAGSGFGTFAMMYAAVGAEVLAVDLRPDRLAAADRRLAFYHETTGETLAVRNLRADLTREWERNVDLVWVYNALSHIDPLDPFIQKVREHLKPGGVLVVGDINGGNPIHLERLSHVRDQVHQEYVAPDGQRHAYAVERTFTPSQMRAVMESNGLRVVHHELYWGGLATLPGPIYDWVMQPLQRQWRLGERRARRQLIVAGRGD